MATKKDYEAIGNIIRERTSIFGFLNKDILVENLSDYFAKDNPNFDRDKFYKACCKKEK